MKFGVDVLVPFGVPFVRLVCECKGGCVVVGLDVENAMSSLGLM